MVKNQEESPSFLTLNCLNLQIDFYNPCLALISFEFNKYFSRMIVII